MRSKGGRNDHVCVSGVSDRGMSEVGMSDSRLKGRKKTSFADPSCKIGWRESCTTWPETCQTWGCFIYWVSHQMFFWYSRTPCLGHCHAWLFYRKQSSPVYSQTIHMWCCPGQRHGQSLKGNVGCNRTFPRFAGNMFLVKTYETHLWMEMWFIARLDYQWE